MFSPNALHKFAIAAILAAPLSVFAQPAYYQDAAYGNGPQENVTFGVAEVLRVQPVYDTVRVNQPREVCRGPSHTQRDPNDRGRAGALLGAIVGGALGNQVGKGDGRKAATIAGAVIGGMAGHDMDINNGGRGRGGPQCQVIDEYYDEQRLMGYDVEYRYKGDIFVTRMDRDPGRRLRVRVSVRPEG
jgi:uncharacterized protein YcfJ